MSTQIETPSNIPEFSVSELAFSVKRTVEETFGRVRVRGELSRVSIPKSGHMYTSLKDDKSVIDAVCWKGVVSRLSIRPEEGLEVICTGKMTTYPGSSKYQMVIDSMELAGEGALLKMLEQRKKQLAAEGLFSAERKKAIPFLPERIGVVTSPTGAVIRDILHRLNDRFPRHVMVWPVKVQGAGANEEIKNAIDGFNALPLSHRPDVIIVARGGGSLEDLMAFNEENVVRATANSIVPIISAVGHETDTTLIDYAADLRAPTPTGAAEMAVPVRLNLVAQIADDETRLKQTVIRLLSEHRHKLEALSAKLGNPERLLEIKTQHVDRTGERLTHMVQNLVTHKKQEFIEKSSGLSHPKQLIDTKTSQLTQIKMRTDNAFQHFLMQKSNTLTHTSGKLSAPKSAIHSARNALTRWSEQLLTSVKRGQDNQSKSLLQLQEKLELLSFENVLKRGYVVVRDAQNKPVTDTAQLAHDEAITLQFKDDKKIEALIKDSPTIPKAPITQAKNKSKPPPENQGQLF